MKWINMLSQNIGNEQDLFQNESSFAVIFIRRDQKTNAFEPSDDIGHYTSRLMECQ